MNHPKFAKTQKSIQETQGFSAPKVHSVMPPDDEDLLFMQQMGAVMEQVESNEEKITVLDDSALQKELEKKKVLEKLILFKSPVTKDFVIDGMNFKLKLLNSDDNVKVFRELKKLTPDEQVIKTSLMLVAASLVDINGITLSEVYSGPAEITDPLLQAYYEINNWPVALSNALSEAFQKFTKETEQGFTKDFLKK